MMQAPDMMYGDPSAMMGGAGGIGSHARLYQAGAKGAAGPGRGSAADKSNVAGDDMGGGGGQFVQVMDPEGKLYYLPQGQH